MCVGVLGLDGVEKAIRTALEKGDAENREFREKIYRSAFAALERVLTANDSITQEAADARRDRLKSKISSIESEFIPAVAMPGTPPPVQPVQPKPAAPVLPEASIPTGLPGDPPMTAPSPSPRPAPEPDATAFPGMGDDAISLSEAELTPDVEPEISIGSDDVKPATPSLEVPAPKPNERPRPARRRPFALIFLIATLIAAAGIAYWWTMDSGILKSSEERDTSVPNPPKSLQEESFRPAGPSRPPLLEGEAENQRDWITMFTPADPTSVNASTGTLADIVREGDETFLRVRSTAAGEAGSIQIDIGQGLLEQLAGSGVVFSIKARSDADQPTEMSISCDFANLGNCGRRRFEVGASVEDFLFEIDLPDVTPGAGGALTINPDFTNQNRAVNIFQVRVAPVE